MGRTLVAGGSRRTVKERRRYTWNHVTRNRRVPRGSPPSDSHLNSCHLTMCAHCLCTTLRIPFSHPNSVSHPNRILEFPKQSKTLWKGSCFLTRQDCKLPSWETPRVDQHQLFFKPTRPALLKASDSCESRTFGRGCGWAVCLDCPPIT